MDLQLIDFDTPMSASSEGVDSSYRWVVGDEPYVSLHILGGERYAA